VEFAQFSLGSPPLVPRLKRIGLGMGYQSPVPLPPAVTTPWKPFTLGYCCVNDWSHFCKLGLYRKFGRVELHFRARSMTTYCRRTWYEWIIVFEGRLLLTCRF